MSGKIGGITGVRTWENGSVSIGSSSTKVWDKDYDTKVLVLTNDSDEDIYLSIMSGATMNKGLRLNSSGGVVYFEYPNIY